MLMVYTITHGIGGVRFYQAGTGSMSLPVVLSGVPQTADGVNAPVVISIDWSSMQTCTGVKKRLGLYSLWDHDIRIGAFRTRTAIGSSGKSISITATCTFDV
jgi:hypothetical protein